MTVTADRARDYLETVTRHAHLRLDAGHHPDDVMTDAAFALEAWVRVHVDGAVPTKTPESAYLPPRKPVIEEESG